MRRAAVLSAAVTLLAALPAQADETLAWAKAFAGVWTLSGLTEGAAFCGVTLGETGTIGGADIGLSATCRRNFPLEEVTGWTLRGRDLLLIDALRKPVLAFHPAPDGSFRASLPGGMEVSLDRGAPTAPRSRKDLLDGSFTLSGPNNHAPCGFFVTARTDTDGTLEQAGACTAAWKDKRWQGWRIRDGRLNLLAADGAVILSLMPGDAFTFTTEEAGAPLFFGPGVIEQPR